MVAMGKELMTHPSNMGLKAFCDDVRKSGVSLSHHRQVLYNWTVSSISLLAVQVINYTLRS